MCESSSGPRHSSYLVALTGGIASGKSAVADRFAALGAGLVDTDVIAREVVAPGQTALELIRETFGDGVIDEQGKLDRRALRALVFRDSERRKRLETILHPRIREVALERIRQSAAPYCILVIPLLAETGGFPGVERVLLVDADRETRKQRLMARDGVSDADAEAALSSQASDDERRAIADDVIDNSGSMDALDSQVALLHGQYLEFALQR
jgi:dephospho-CoA kinase